MLGKSTMNRHIRNLRVEYCINVTLENTDVKINICLSYEKKKVFLDLTRKCH